MKRNEAVTLITAALLANPERYKYIVSKMEGPEGISQKEATEKNICKAMLIVDRIEQLEGPFSIKLEE